MTHARTRSTTLANVPDASGLSSQPGPSNGITRACHGQTRTARPASGQPASGPALPFCSAWSAFGISSHRQAHVRTGSYFALIDSMVCKCRGR